MKALFVSLYANTPHFETELELMSDLLEEGHEVHVLRCTGVLGTCMMNPAHKPGWCRICVSKIDNGLRAIGRARLHVHELPEVAADQRLQDLFATAEELKLYSFEGANLGRGVYSSLCERFDKDTKFDTAKYATEIRTELRAAHHSYIAAREALKSLRPDRVYIFNGRFSICYPVIEACEQAGVEFYTHERGGTVDRYLLRKNVLPHDIRLNEQEINTVWGQGEEEKRAIARRWYHDRRDGVERNWISFTKTQSVGKLPTGFDPGRLNIAVFCSTMEEYAAIKGWELTLYPDEVEGLRQIVDSLRSRADAHIYLRIHPNLKTVPRDGNYQLRAYAEMERAATNLTIIWPESPVHTYSLVDASSVTLTFGSTVGVEACFWKRPSVLAGRAQYENLGCCYVPRSHADLVEMLLAGLPAKDDLGALKYAYWDTVRGSPYKRFKPTGLYTGEFDGRECRPSMTARVHSAMLRVLGH